MFFGALAAASLLFSVNAYAQENNNRDENGKIVRGAYETNKAFDNTFISLGVGYNAGLNFGNGGSVPFFQAPGGLALDLGFGKMWTPFIGILTSPPVMPVYTVTTSGLPVSVSSTNSASPTA